MSAKIKNAVDLASLHREADAAWTFSAGHKFAR